MHRGDISNEVEPRWLFVWEDQLAHLPTENRGRYQRALTLHRYQTAVRCWVPDTFNVRWLNDFAWRQGQKIDGVTFMRSEEWAALIQDWCDYHDLPIANVYYFEDRLTLGRRLSTWPSIRGVIDQQVPGAYGVKGFAFGKVK